MDNEKLIESFVEVTFKKEEDFLKIRETLSRIGIASRDKKKLSQTCYILHKKGRYYLVHFLEMFLLDGKESHFTDEDKGRRNTIAALLQEWNLLTVVNTEAIKEPRSSMRKIKVVPFSEKSEWEFAKKYSIGSRKPQS